MQKYEIVPNAFSATAEFRELVDVLQQIVHNAAAFLGVHNCSVALLDATESSLVTLAALPVHGLQVRHTRFHLNEGIAGWVAGHRTAALINNVDTDPRFKRLGRISIGSILCVPLLNHDTLLGTLTVTSSNTDAFTTEHLQKLELFKAQAILSIVNAQQALLARQQVRRLERLLRLSRSMTSRFEPDALYRAILSDVRYLVPCQLAVIYLYSEKNQALATAAAWSRSHTSSSSDHESSALASAELQEYIDLGDIASVSAQAALHRHPLIRGPQSDTSAGPLLAELSAPFVAKDRLYGVITLKRTQPFSSQDLRLIRYLCNMAAIALENLELFRQARSDQEQFHALLASSIDGIALLDGATHFMEVNTSFAQIFELEPAQIAGMPCLELFGCSGSHAPQACLERCMIRQALLLNQPLPYTEIDLDIQGTSHLLGISITPLALKHRPMCLLVARDVTAVRDASRSRANFLSMITHELRSPLNAINGYLELVLSGVGGELNEQQHEFLQRARSGSEHLYALLEDLLLISRADSGQLRLNRDLISLPEVVVNAVEELELTAADHGLTIAMELADDLPPLYADALRLQQVLRNLVGNALRFTPAGGLITISACLEAAPLGLVKYGSAVEVTRVVKLQVSDTGAGIAPELHERIFERFFQAPNVSSSRAGGQGLGLAIVKMIVELHGGCVLVESADGCGSTFTCLLPCLLI